MYKRLPLFENFSLSVVNNLDVVSNILYVGNHGKMLGIGSSRIVYDLKNGTVLKLAKNDTGLVQNLTEFRISSNKKYSEILATVIKCAPDGKWLIQKKTNKIDETTFHIFANTDPTNFFKWLRYGKKYFLQDYTIGNAMLVKELIIEYDLYPPDIANISSWGILNGEILLSDYGLTLETAKKMYKSLYMKYELKKMVSLMEGKQVGLLYHFTSIDAMLHIVANNELGKNDDKYEKISATRNKNFYKSTKIIPTECCIILDGDKISNKYKISPTDYNYNKGFGLKPTKNFEDQYEELIHGQIKPLSKYTKRIFIFDIDFDAVYGEEDTMQYLSNVMNVDSDDISYKDIIDFIESKGFKVIVGRSIDALESISEMSKIFKNKMTVDSYLDIKNFWRKTIGEENQDNRSMKKDLFRKKGKMETIRIDNIIPNQDYLNSDKVEEFRKNPPNSLPMGVAMPYGVILYDGHHRTATKILNKEKYIDMLILYNND